MYLKCHGSTFKYTNFDVLGRFNDGWWVKASKELIRGDERENDIDANNDECDYDRNGSSMAETAKGTARIAPSNGVVSIVG